MGELQIGIVLGFFIYSALVTVVALLTKDEDETLSFAIGIGWFGYFIALLFCKYVNYMSNKLKRTRSKRHRSKGVYNNEESC